MRKMLIGYVLFFAALFALFFGNKVSLLRTENYYKHKSESGTLSVARAQGKEFAVYDNGEWRDLFITGVNVGAAKPGYYPGDFGITKDDYLRWFGQISAMNANTIRVYVLQTPDFYRALKEYNDTAEKPLYIMHGVYMNEASILEYQDAYAEDGLIYNSFLSDIRSIVDVIHGNATIEHTAGHASGTYTVDISRYVIGWILGIEWEAEFVSTTNENNPEHTHYDGEYLYAENVTPFEVMLAAAADTAISYEMANYNEQRPLAMSNWVTSDPLEHPGEPNPEVEDAVSVDMNNLIPKDGFEAGFFASYHVYPYYPDLFSYADELLQDDPPNSYRAYIRELNDYHSDMPVLVSEVGIPASRGIAHTSKYSGFNQGNVTEQEQGEMLVSLMGDIYDEGLMGAIVFSWQDEWFKKTWNTQSTDIADRRPFWMDYQTNEQSFGLLAFDPGEEQSVSYVDGDASEWSDADVVLENDGQRLSMKSDEQFIYLMIETDSFGNEPLYLPFDVIAGQGNTHYGDIPLQMGADFVLVLDGEDGSTVLVDPYYDTTYYEFAMQSLIIKRSSEHEKTNTGRFTPITLMLSRGIYDVSTGETVPYETFDTGKLRYGIANPSLPGYDSIADFYAGDGIVEIRLPWHLLNISDPSSKQAIGDLYANNGVTALTIESIGVSLLTQGTAQSATSARYSWEGWEAPTYHERLKGSYPIIQQFFGSIESAERPVRSSAELFWGRWNQTQFSNIGFWFPIQPVLNYAIAFLLSVVIYFFLVLMYIHASSVVKAGRRKLLERRFLTAVEGGSADVYMTRSGKYRLKGVRRPFSRSNLIIFRSLIEQADEQKKEDLRETMLKIGYEDYVIRQLRTRDIGYLILLVRLIGDLRLTNQADTIKNMLYSHKKHTDLQYQGLLTLSALGAHEQIVAITMDEKFVQTLSFRSLQEIAKSYRGDKLALYAALLDSPDTFIRRITIKRIGAERISTLAPSLLPHLEAQNFNVVIDATRSLGQLGSREAAPKIETLMEHPQWEVRAVAVTALAAIDMEAFEKPVVKALSDPEWTVRNNAATALCKSAEAERILLEIEATKDRYAYEMLKYMMETHGIWGAQT